MPEGLRDIEQDGDARGGGACGDLRSRLDDPPVGKYVREGHQIQPQAGQVDAVQSVEVDPPVTVHRQVDQFDSVTGRPRGQHHRVGPELAWYHTDPPAGGQWPGVDERGERGGRRVMEGHVVGGQIRTQQASEVGPQRCRPLAVAQLGDVSTDPALLRKVLGTRGHRGPTHPRAPGRIEMDDLAAVAGLAGRTSRRCRHVRRSHGNERRITEPSGPGW